MGGENGWEGNGESGASDGWAGIRGVGGRSVICGWGGAAGGVSRVPHSFPVVSSAFQTYFVPQWVPKGQASAGLAPCGGSGVEMTGHCRAGVG